MRPTPFFDHHYTLRRIRKGFQKLLDMVISW
jgi:hypothetical protein